MSRLTDMVAAKMGDFRCECEAILEPHRKRDCAPVWRAVMRHENGYGPAVRACETIPQAANLYPEEGR